VFANTDSNDKIQKRSAHLAENPEFQALGVGPRMRLLLLQRSQKYISGYECGVVPVGSCASRGVCEALSSLYFTVSDPPRQQALDWYIQNSCWIATCLCGLSWRAAGHLLDFRLETKQDRQAVLQELK